MKTIFKRLLAVLLAITIIAYMIISLIYLSLYSTEYEHVEIIEWITAPGMFIWIVVFLVGCIWGMIDSIAWILNVLGDWYIS